MRYRHDTYTISGQTITLTGITTVTTADVRLIIDETAKKVICSSMQKSNISCSNNVITVPSAVAMLDASHEYTIELDFGGDDAHNLAQFFGLPESLPGSYTALTQAEVIASTRAEQVNAWGEDGCPIPNYLPEGITEQMVEAAAIALGITYYEPNFNIASL